MKRDSKILGWLHSIVLTMKQEFKHIFRDEAVVIFFVVLALVYPPLYSLIYNPEVAREEAVVVVDDSHSELSRQFVRDLDASPDVDVVAYAHNMDEARELMATKKCADQRADGDLLTSSRREIVQNHKS